MRAIYFSILCATANLFCLPQEISIEKGSASIHQQTSHNLKIQVSDKTILQCKSFDISSYETVEFIQPNSSSTILTRVQSKDPTRILGSLQGNGKIFLVNQNGIYFGAEAKVSASSFLASTLDITNENFLQDRFLFVLNSHKNDSFIRNDGVISATEGAIVLLAPIIQNKGILQAGVGEVLLSSAEQVTLNFAGNHLLSFAAEGEIKDALIENLGSIQAQGGSVFMHLPMARKAIKATLNTDGIESGAVFVEENGKIILAPLSAIQTKELSFQGSEIEINGSIDLSNNEEKGGTFFAKGNDIFVEQAVVDVSGKNSGGSIRIQADRLSITRASTFIANGSEQGYGGSAILLAKEDLQFHGSIYAKGGLQGGFIETSSLGSLNVIEGFVDTSSCSGERGQWLIDPSLIRITASGGGIPADCQTGGIIDVATLEAQGSTVSLCADTIIQEVPISMAAPGAGLIFSSPPNSVGSLILQDNITTKSGVIEVNNLDIVLNSGIILATTGSGSLGANITLGNIETNSFAYPLTLTSGIGEIHLEHVGTISAVGATTLSGSKITLRTLKTEDSPINITGPVVVPANAVLSTGITGADIHLDSVEALSNDSSILLDAGRLGTLFIGPIGSNNPLYDVTIERATNAFLEDITTLGGSIIIRAPSTLTQPLTTFSILEGGLEAEIHLQSVNGSGSLHLATNLANRVTLLSSGETTPLNQIIIDQSREVTLGSIRAGSIKLVESIGNTTLQADIIAREKVDIRGGRLLLNGILEAPIVKLFSHGHTLSTSSHQHIFFDTSLSIEAQGANIGTARNPITLTTTNSHALILLGAKDLASLAGRSYQKKLIQLNPTNTPCVVLFNNRIIYDCNKNQRILFNLIKKSLFLNGYQNAQHLGIGKNPLLQLGPYFLSSYYTYDFPEKIIDFSSCETIDSCQGQPREFQEEIESL